MFKIVVCVKQVPDTAGGVKFKADGTLDRGAMLAIMNPDDKAGLEAALRIKDQDPENVKVTLSTMGLPKAEDVLVEGIAMGADDALLVTDRVLGGADTWATSSTIAGALKNMEYDLIITGRQAIDGDTAQVGPQIAEHLSLPMISYAKELNCDTTNKTIEVKRIFDDGYMMVKSQLPALVTCLAELNEPRYMKPGRIFYALDHKDELVTVWGRANLDVDDSNIGLKGSPTKIAKASDKVAKGKGTTVTPESDGDAADYILNVLTEKHVI